MRNINFSSYSLDNLARSSASRGQLYDQNPPSSSDSLANSNSAVQDHRFLHKPAAGVGSNALYSNLAQNSHGPGWKQTGLGQLKSKADCLSKPPYPDLGSSASGRTAENNDRLTRTPFPHAYKPDGYLRSEANIGSYGSFLSLLPPSRFSLNSETRSIFNKLSENISKYSVGFVNEELPKDPPQTCKKRNLQQVYKQSDDAEYEEFYDAISGDENTDGESLNNPNKRSNILPLQKKAYSQTPSTVAQTGLLGTQNNTPNKPKATYGLPLSLIDDDYRPEQTPSYNFTAQNSQYAQKQSYMAGLTQYSHPYNFPKTPGLPLGAEPAPSCVPSSVQRIRTPLRYRSSLLEALSNRTNSSCKMLSAAEMKKIFCKSRRPIGCLKDFVHTIEVRTEESEEPKKTFELPKMVERRTEIENALEEETKKSFQDSSPRDHSKYSKQVIANSKAESAHSSKPLPTTLNTLPAATKEPTLWDELKEKKPIENTGPVDTSHSAEVLPDLSASLYADSDLKLSPYNELENKITDAADSVEEKDAVQEAKGGSSEDTAPKSKDPEVSEGKKEDAVPWWLANVNKPNLVEVDNEGVFMPDEDEEPKNKEEKPAVSALGLFSPPSTEGASKEGNKDSLFSSINVSKAEGSTNISASSSLFDPSLLQFNKTNENINDNKPEEKGQDGQVSSLPTSTGQFNLFSLNQGSTSNSPNGLSLFGATPKTLDGGKDKSETGNSAAATLSGLEKSSLEPRSVSQVSLFGNQTPPGEEKKRPEGANSGIFGMNSSGSLFAPASISGGNLAPQQGSSMGSGGQTFGAPSAPGLTQNAFNTGGIFNLASSTGASAATSGSEKQDSSLPVFGLKDFEGKKPSSDASLATPLSFGSLNSSSNPSFAVNNTTSPQTSIPTGGLFDSKILNFGASANPASSTAPTSLFGNLNTSNAASGQTSSLFSMPPGNSSLLSGLNSNSGTVCSTNQPSSTPAGSIFGVQPVQTANTAPAQNNFNFASGSGIAESSSSLTGPRYSTNTLPQTPHIFGSNLNSNTFVFGSSSSSSSPQDQTSEQNLGQNTGSNLFASPQGIFNPIGTTETSNNMFGGMSNNSPPAMSLFGQTSQASGQPAINTNLFGSNSPDLLGVAPLMGGSTGSNPFVGHSSNSTGGTSHRRRIARAKRSH